MLSSIFICVFFLVSKSAANPRLLFLPQSATVHLQPGTLGDSGTPVGGTLNILQTPLGVHITGVVTGLEPGKHGFHVHEKGALGNECKDAGGHFNPLNRKHGDPRDYHRHIGDLGNIEADLIGNAYVDVKDPHASLNPLSSGYIGNLAIVVHAGEDDLGLAGNDGSLKTGNAGARRACGIIEVSKLGSSSGLVKTSLSPHELQPEHKVPLQQNQPLYFSYDAPISRKVEGYSYYMYPVPVNPHHY